MEEIGARLKQLHLSSTDPHRLAQHYAQVFQLDVQAQADHVKCHAEHVHVQFSAGEAGQLKAVSFVFQDAARFAQYQQLMAQRVMIESISATAFSVRDPLGHQVIFELDEQDQNAYAAELRLQHFGLRAIDIDGLSDFYIHVLGFSVSDRVYNDDQELTAIFLRTDQEHHAFAIFKSPLNRFDHFSCEVPDWEQMKNWADHMAQVNIELVWGIGRHGPGNDTFFMVKDADGNMGEISAELEQCQPGRPIGTWKHHPLTLNQWGVAIMRC